MTAAVLPTKVVGTVKSIASLAGLLVFVACSQPGDDAAEGTEGPTTGGATGDPMTTSSGQPMTASSTAAESTGASGSSDSSSASTAQTASSEASSDSGTTTEGDPPKGECGTANLVGCYRGMYLSLWSDNAGQIDFGGDTEQHRFILGDAAKEQLVLDFIGTHRIESLALYNMGSILGDEDLELALESFMGRAREAGVLRIDAISATSTSTWDNIADFHESHAPFDGFVTEIEFWNDGATFDEFMATLEYIRAFGLVGPGGGPTTLSVYVGWIDQGQVDAMLGLIDRAWVHVYVDAAPTAFGYGEERIEMFANANEAQNREVEIWPIFSAEDNQWSAGSETFMGEWLTENGLDAAELAVLADYEAAPVYERIEVSGHQYFSYFFLERYLAR